MGRYIINRILLCFLVLIGVSLVSFAILHLSPGDPVRQLLPIGSTQEEINDLRERLGLNRPLYIQYLAYMQGVIKGDLGTSLYFKKPSIDIIKERIPATLLLTSTAFFGALLFSIPLGIIAALNKGSFIDLFAMFFALLGVSISPVWLGLLLIFFFSVRLRLLPSFGYGTLSALILPAISLGVLLAALITRLTRAGMIEVLSEDYILAIRSKGIKEKKVIYRYALKNVLIPIITIVGLQFPGVILGGAVVTEAIFCWPGLGQLAVSAIYSRDFPLIQAIILVVAGFFVGITLLVDIIYTFLDPRIKLY